MRAASASVTAEPGWLVQIASSNSSATASGASAIA